ncbi:MAG: hypothetical protein ACWGMY_01130 [Hyphomicrobiaceae bacterium]
MSAALLFLPPALKGFSFVIDFTGLSIAFLTVLADGFTLDFDAFLAAGLEGVDLAGFFAAFLKVVGSFLAAVGGVAAVFAGAFLRAVSVLAALGDVNFLTDDFFAAAFVDGRVAVAVRDFADVAIGSDLVLLMRCVPRGVVLDPARTSWAILGSGQCSPSKICASYVGGGRACQDNLLG